MDMGFQVLHHLDDPDVRAAVLGALEGAQRRRDGRIGVGAGGRDDVGGEGGVVAAAVLHMEDEGEVEDPGLQFGVLLVRAEHPQEILGGR